MVVVIVMLVLLHRIQSKQIEDLEVKINRIHTIQQIHRLNHEHP